MRLPGKPRNGDAERVTFIKRCRELRCTYRVELVPSFHVVVMAFQGERFAANQQATLVGWPTGTRTRARDVYEDLTVLLEQGMV